MLKTLFVLFKGFMVGGTMTVPGVSGGSMAMILGIYDRLITSIASFTKNPKKNALFLIEFGLSALLGIGIIARFVISPLLDAYKMPVSYFFLGAVAGGIPIIFKTAGVKKFSVGKVLWPIVGIIAVLLISLIPSGIFSSGQGFTLWSVLLQIFGGVIIAVALILPGISVAQMLLMLGLYEPIMSINSFDDIFVFIPLGIGVLVGSIVCAKLMQKAMARFPQQTYLIVFGFLLGSLPKLFPGIPMGLENILCMGTLVLGFLFIFLLQTFESKKTLSD